MRFLVLGASGMAGHTISIYLKEQGHQVIGFARRNLDFVETIIGDAMNINLVSEIIKSGKYDAIINAIGVLNKKAEECKSEAVFINSYYPHFLASITKTMKTQVVHLSTDCVFSGKAGNYTEMSFRDGETFYDRTKALGELVDQKNITLRNSIIGPDINPKGMGLMNWFLQQNSDVKGYTKVMWTGMTTLQLAKVIEKCVQQNITGLYNMVPDKNISKYELLILFNKYLKDRRIKIEKYDEVEVNKTLVRTNFQFQDKVPSYEKMIFEMADWIYDHKELYPHYNLGKREKING